MNPYFTSASTDQPANTLTVRGLRKAYGATVALECVSFDIQAGEIHALLGENGAGKSTLVKILSGVVAADAGEVLLCGTAGHHSSVMEARQKGIATAFQEISLLPNLTVAQNLALPQQATNWLGLVDDKRNEARAMALLQAHHLTDIHPHAWVGDLTLAHRQRLEIARALAAQPRLLILDEPSAVQASTDWLFEQVRAAAARGTAVLYVSHRLAEIRELCQNGTVLRNGKSVATVQMHEVDDAGIFELMVGKHRTARAAHTNAAARRPTIPRLSVSHLSAGQIRDVSFDVKPGEILGIAALDGQGQADLFHALFGLIAIQRGDIRIDGRKVKISSPRAAMKAGVDIALLPEERKTEGIFPYLTVQDNVVIARPAAASRAGMLWRARARQAMRSIASRVDLAECYFDFPINELSGGNQQKTLLARTLRSGARTLLLFDPTRGVDVGTKEAIYAAIRDYAAHDGAVVLYSSELAEITALCGRCVVIYNGCIASLLEDEAVIETHIVAAATGHADAIAIRSAA